MEMACNVLQYYSEAKERREREEINKVKWGKSMEKGGINKGNACK
jgi:hypothetical protein